MKYFLIMNPKSRGGRSALQFDMILNRLHENGLDYSYSLATTYPEMYQLSRQANLSNYDVIVAVGGDGTINATLNGFYDENGHRISRAAMAVIYTGTSPDFCKSYNIPLKTEEAAELLAKNTSRNIRIMRISMISEKEKKETIRYYACCANIGLGASVARNSNELRKKTGDLLGTLISLIKAIASYKSRQFNLCIDGTKNTLNDIINISAGRTRYIASGIKVDKGMDDTDARCYLMIAKKPGLKSLLPLLSQAYSGKIHETGVLSRRFAAEVWIDSTMETEVEFDGDPAGYLPCKITLAHDPLRLIAANF